MIINIIIILIVVLAFMAVSVRYIKFSKNSFSRVLCWCSVLLGLISFYFIVSVLMTRNISYLMSYLLIGKLVGAFSVSLSLIGIVREKIYRKEKMTRIETEKKQKEENQHALDFFNKCKQKGVLSVATTEEINSLNIIARSMGISNLEEAKQLFEKGKSVAADVEAEAIKSQKQKEEETFQEEKAKAEIKGKDKYLSKIRKEAESHKKSAAAAEAMGKIYVKESFSHQAQTQNWGVAGGIAEAIAGPAAGVAAALDVQRKNEQAKASAEKNRQACRNISNQMFNISFDEASKQRNAEWKIKRIDEKIIDDSDVRGKFEILEFSNWHFELLETKNIRATSFVNVKEPVKLLGSKALLDGSIMIIVYDKTGKIVGSGYYSAPGFDETDLSKIGFTSKSNLYISALCITDETIENTEGLYCEVMPVNMWTMEI